MKTLNILVILSLASVLALGCIGHTATPTPLPAPAETPTPAPTIAATPLPTYLPVSYISNVQQTTNGRNYTAPSITAIPNASKGGLMTGELGRQR